MGAARVSDLVADLRVGLRHTPIGEIKEVVSNTLLDRLLQSGDIFRQSRIASMIAQLKAT